MYATGKSLKIGTFKSKPRLPVGGFKTRKMTSLINNTLILTNVERGY